MIMCKENVVRYVVEIDAEEQFRDTFEVAHYIEEMFIREGMEREVEKMRRKGWTLRLIEENSYSKSYAVEYITMTTY